MSGGGVCGGDGGGWSKTHVVPSAKVASGDVWTSWGVGNHLLCCNAPSSWGITLFQLMLYRPLGFRCIWMILDVDLIT